MARASAICTAVRMDLLSVGCVGRAIALRKTRENAGAFSLLADVWNERITIVRRAVRRWAFFVRRAQASPGEGLKVGP